MIQLIDVDKAPADPMVQGHPHGQGSPKHTENYLLWDLSDWNSSDRRQYSETYKTSLTIMRGPPSGYLHH